jgi:hypothetical protein
LCLLPPQCLFCIHYDLNAGPEGPDCAAFREIPEAIYRGRHDHCDAYPGDRGVRFQLDPRRAEEFAEINALRRDMDLAPFGLGRSALRAAG